MLVAVDDHTIDEILGAVANARYHHTSAFYLTGEEEFATLLVAV